MKIKSAKKAILERVLQEAYLGDMTDKRNKEYGDYVEMWKDIPVVLVASISGSVTNIFPFDENEEFQSLNEQLACRIAAEGQVNGALFDMYLDGYVYAIGFNGRDIRRIREAQKKGHDIFVDVMGERIKELRELHHAFYFPQEIPVDSSEEA